MQSTVSTSPAARPSLLIEEGRRSPLVVRVAGLPVESLERLSSGLVGLLAEPRSLAAELAGAREALVAALYEAIHGAERTARRFLLKVKRDAFNQRSIRRHREHRLWSLVESAAGDTAARVLDLELRLEACFEVFESAHAEARQTEVDSLLGLLDERNLRHGLAVGSRSLSLNLDRLSRTPVARFGRKERKAEQVLLRYVARVSNKLSPFSTFTRLALGVAEDRPADEPLTLRGGPWREQSRVVFRRSLMEQYIDLLAEHRDSVREGLKVRLNESIDRLEDGRFIFVRPGGWQMREMAPADDAGEGERATGELGLEMSFRQPRLVRVKLGGAVIEWLLAELADRETSRQQLVETLVERFADHDAEAAEHLERTVGRLLETGFLRRVYPWPTDVPEFDRFALDYLEGLDDDALEPIRRDLRKLVAIRDGFSADDQPARRVETVRWLADRLWATTQALCGVEARQRHEAGESYFLYEDVFLSPRAGVENDGVIALAREPLERAVASLTPLVRVDNLVSRHHDVLLTFGAAAERRWPGRRRVPFMEFLAEQQSLWQDFAAWERGMRTEPKTGQTWNPLELPELDTLRRHRERVTAAIESRRVAAEGRDYLTPEWLDELCADIPGSAAEARDFCAFVQPLDATGERFVVNELFEGAGRHGSRYTWVMDPASHRFLTDHFLRRSRRMEVNGEAMELLDVLCPGGNYINVHRRQTPRILQMPGERSSCDPQHVVQLRDLAVDLRGAGRSPRLVDPAGQPVAPINLCPLLMWFMPTLLKFLTVFGPGTLRHIVVGQPTRIEGDLAVSDRLWLGNALIQRRRWQFRVAEMLERIEGLSEARAFAEINAWREDHGLPARVFYSEPFAHRYFDSRLKPQYIDFDSPLCVQILRQSLDQRYEWLGFEELAPGPEAMAIDPTSGRRVAIEIQLDSVALSAEPATESRGDL